DVTREVSARGNVNVIEDQARSALGLRALDGHRGPHRAREHPRDETARAPLFAEEVDGGGGDDDGREYSHRSERRQNRMPANASQHDLSVYDDRASPPIRLVPFQFTSPYFVLVRLRSFILNIPRG